MNGADSSASAASIISRALSSLPFSMDTSEGSALPPPLSQSRLSSPGSLSPRRLSPSQSRLSASLRRLAPASSPRRRRSSSPQRLSTSLATTPHRSRMGSEQTGADGISSPDAVPDVCSPDVSLVSLSALESDDESAMSLESIDMQPTPFEAGIQTTLAAAQVLNDALDVAKTSEATAQDINIAIRAAQDVTVPWTLRPTEDPDVASPKTSKQPRHSSPVIDSPPAKVQRLVDYSLTDGSDDEPPQQDVTFGNSTLDVLHGPWSPVSDISLGDSTLDYFDGPMTPPPGPYRFNREPRRTLKRSHSLETGGGLEKMARDSSAPRPSSQPPPSLFRQPSDASSGQPSVNSPPLDADNPLTGFDASHYYELVPLGEKEWRRGPVKDLAFKIKMIRDLPSSNSILRLMMLIKVLEAAFRELILQGHPDATGQLIAFHPLFGSQGGIPSCRKKLRELTFSDLLEQLLKVIQSNTNIRLEEVTFYLNVFYPTVGGETRRVEDRTMSWQEHFISKNSLYNPTRPVRGKISNQGLCVPLVIAKELKFLENQESRSKLNMYLKSKEAIAQAKALVQQAGLAPSEGPFNLDQLQEFSKVLPPDVSLHFYDDEAPPFLSFPKPGDRRINIFLLYNGPRGREEDAAAYHAYGISSLSGFMGATRKEQFCLKCYKIHYARSEEGHKCDQAVCKACKRIACTNTQPKDYSKSVYCAKCNLHFFTEDCKNAHFCTDKNKCEWCGLVQNKKNPRHTCGTAYCIQCQSTHAPQEQCFVQQDTKSKKKKGKKRATWYADAECTVGVDGQHQANLLVLRKPDMPPGEYIEYKGIDAMDKFVKDCIEETTFAHSYVVFHNASGYDAHLWLRALDKASAMPKDIILKGQKLLSMTLPARDIICRDSLLFIPGTPLAAFPRMFGLDCGNKGDFPYKLNVAPWVKFDGGEPTIYEEVIDGRTERFPPLRYFAPEWKSRGELERLTQWWLAEYRRFENDPTLKYVPEDELIRYCHQDVDILAMGFEAYRSAAIKENGSDPLDCITFPSFNNDVFRSKYMAKNSIAVLPPQGYECSKGSGQASIAGLAYVSWKEKAMKLGGFRCGRKGGEVTLNGHAVDGFGVDSSGTQVAINYHGCWVHGHHPSECLNKAKAQKNWKKSPALMKAQREQTKATDAALNKVAEAGKPYGPLTYTAVWACEAEAEEKKNPAMRKYIAEYKAMLTEPLRPRDAMRGGRTNASMHLIEQLPLGYLLHYLDYTSLYPAVNASVDDQEWPIGHPDIYVGKEVDKAPKPGEWFGMAKVKILPPRGLVHPVLAQRIKDKVLFHLCSSCAAEAKEGPCLHSPEKRMIKGTFCTVELDKALEMGYKITHIYETWDWPPERRTKDLFRPMILDLFRKKVLASAKPQDPAKLRQLIQDLASLGIIVKEEEWAPNPVLRTLLKFCLNNIWGFLGKRSDEPTTEFVNTLSRLLEITTDEKRQITKVRVSPGEESLLVSSKPLKERATAKQNIVLAAMTTAYGRLKLYEVLERRPEQVVYYDTDSVVLMVPPGDTPPTTSSCLGGLKDEIEEEYGTGASISSFVALGPKCYSYRVKLADGTETEVLKVKGIRMTAEVADLVDGDALRRLASGQPPLLVPQHNIRKDVFEGSLTSHSLEKSIRFYCSKRYLRPHPNPHLNTLPFGF